METGAPFSDFTSGADIAYALDDGMPFPGWTPPLLGDAEARAGYEAGERMAVIAGDPADPTSGLVLDRKNARLALRRADPVIQLVYAGEPLALAEALWWDSDDRECWAHRTSAHELRISRRPRGAAIWVEELLAHVDLQDNELVDWPEFGAWSALTNVGVAPWIGDGAPDLVDADGWMLDALEAVGVTATWRELGRKYDAPRAFGLPPDVQEKLAIPLGWQAAGRAGASSTSCLRRTARLPPRSRPMPCSPPERARVVKW